VLSSPIYARSSHSAVCVYSPTTQLELLFWSSVYLGEFYLTPRFSFFCACALSNISLDVSRCSSGAFLKTGNQEATLLLPFLLVRYITFAKVGSIVSLLVEEKFGTSGKSNLYFIPPRLLPCYIRLQVFALPNFPNSPCSSYSSPNHLCNRMAQELNIVVLFLLPAVFRFIKASISLAKRTTKLTISVNNSSRQIHY
jgi:hypothetical protein